MSATNPIDALKNALYVHAKQVENFCRAEFNRSQAEVKAENVRAVKSARGQKLVRQLEELIKTARGSEILTRAINLEQLEARTDRLMMLLDDEMPETLGA